MGMSAEEVGDRVVAMCLGLGFADAGVCAAGASERGDEFRAWIAAGKQGEMGYLERDVEKRLDPRELMSGARSVVMVADQYWVRGAVDCEEAAAGEGRVARYARGADYHEVMKKRLHALCDALRAEHPGHEFRAFVDTAPVLEREHAVRAGLGWIGKNTLLIHPRRGSWMFLGGVLTTLEMAVAGPRRVRDHCGTCTRCIDACPTGAITPYSVDARRCVSYLTIERRTETAPPRGGEMAAGSGEWLYGCDVCQEVCPHNSARGEGVEVGEAHPAYTPKRSGFDLLEVLGWTEEDRRRALSGTAMKRAKLGMWKRNAEVVMDGRRARP